MANIARTQYPVGVGIPGGGTTGQVLAKKTDNDFDQQWSDPPPDASPSLQHSYSYSNLVYATRPDYTNGYSLAVSASVWLPVYVPQSVTIKAIATYVKTTAASAVLQYGAHTHNAATGLPDMMIASTAQALSLTANTVTSLSFSPTCTLPAGWVWLWAYNNKGAAAFSIAATLQQYFTGMPIIHYGNLSAPQRSPQVGPYYTYNTFFGHQPPVTAVLAPTTVPYISYTVAD